MAPFFFSIRASCHFQHKLTTFLHTHNPHLSVTLRPDSSVFSYGVIQKICLQILRLTAASQLFSLRDELAMSVKYKRRHRYDTTKKFYFFTFYFAWQGYSATRFASVSTFLFYPKSFRLATKAVVAVVLMLLFNTEDQK